MKKFVLLHQGFEPPTPEIHEAVGKWMASVGDSFVDRGSPFVGGVEITKEGRSELTLESDSPTTGYAIVEAESLEAAEKLVEPLPIIDSIRIYEAMSM